MSRRTAACASDLQPALIARALMAAADGREKEAIATLEAYLIQRPRAFEMNYYLGLIHENGGQVDDAIARYRRTTDAMSVLGPTEEVMRARLALVRLLTQRGDTAEATQMADTLLAQWANADADFTLLRTLRESR
jgi:tetratricopeptide (TPR) repeat protein